jgi:hypothetical protein
VTRKANLLTALNVCIWHKADISRRSIITSLVPTNCDIGEIAIYCPNFDLNQISSLRAKAKLIARACARPEPLLRATQLAFHVSRAPKREWIVVKHKLLRSNFLVIELLAFNLPFVTAPELAQAQQVPTMSSEGGNK